MTYEKCIWIAVVDDHQGRLLRGRRLRSGRGSRLRLDEVQTIDNPLRELARDARSRAEGPHSAGSRSAELHARYAVDVVKWLAASAQTLRVDELQVFASPRLLALLRSMYPVALARVTTNHSFNLTGAALRELERHPDVLEVVEDRAGRGAKKAS